MTAAEHPSPPADAAAPAPPRRPRVLRWAFGTAIVLGLFAAYHRPILVGYAHALRAEDEAAPSDALMILIGGPDHRPQLAVELYRRGLAPEILIGESQYDAHVQANESEQIRDYLIAEGVPSRAVTILPGGRAKSTYDEAVRLRDYIATHPMRRVTIVTTSFHTTRVHWVFGRVLDGLGVEIHTAAAVCPRFNEEDWFWSAEGLKAYGKEALKHVVYRIRY